MSILLNFSSLVTLKKYQSPPRLEKLIYEPFNKGMNAKLFFVCLFVFQLIFIFQGIELADEGFIATYYQQIFRNPESVQYNFMFWLTGIIGGLYLKLFPFLGLWGLRLGGVLITTGTAILTYSLLKKHLNHNYLKLGLFLVIITLNTDIKELNYNNLSAFVYVTVIYFLYNGLKQHSLAKLFISGMFVSMNFFIRIPNILGAGLVLSILYYGYENKNTLNLMVKQAFVFLAGILTCSGIILLVMYSLGHWHIFLNALQVIYKMGSNSQVKVQDSSYGIFKLLHMLESNNAKSVVFTSCIIIVLISGTFLYSRIKQKFILINRINVPLRYFFILSLLILIASGIIDNYSMLFFYTGIILIAFVLILMTPYNSDTRFLLFCGCFILVSYPFGSSAGIITAGRFSFWIGLPIAINYLANIRSIKNQFNIYSRDSGNSLQLIITEQQMRIIKNIFIMVVIFAGVYQTYFYPYFDRRNRLEMRYSIDNKFLTGIYTTKGRAKAINELLNESSKYVKKGDYVLAYDCIPMYNFLTESVPYIRSSFPWLYETEIFKKELDRAKLEKKVLPVVIMQTIKTVDDGSKWPEETLKTDYSKWEMNLGRNKYMNAFLADNNYKEVWSNQCFKIFIPVNSEPITLK
jgi:hypothetical protein